MLLSLRRPKWKTGLVVHGNTRSADGQNLWHDYEEANVDWTVIQMTSDSHSDSQAFIFF